MAAAWSDAHDLSTIQDTKLKERLLQEAAAVGNGAITLLQRLSAAYDKGGKAFRIEAEKIAEEFDREVRDVYTLWLSPQLEMGD